MEKFRAGWKKISGKEFIEDLTAKLFVFGLLAALVGFLAWLLSFIDFFLPFTEPIINIIMSLFAFATLIYFVWAGCCILAVLVLSTIKLPYMLMDFFTSQEKIRTAIAWMIGIFISVLLIFCLFTLLDTIGIKHFSDSDFFGSHTSAIVFSLMIGARCGMALYEKNIRGGVNDKGEIQFKAWLIGVLTFGILTSIKNLVFRNGGHFQWFIEILDIALIGIIFAVLKPWCDIKISKLSKGGGEKQEDESLGICIFFNLIIVAMLAVCLGLFGVFLWAVSAIL